MTLAHLLLRQARAQGDRAVLFEGAAPRGSYRDWAARSAGAAAKLRAAGLVSGDRVVLFMRNHTRYLELLWAAWWAGLVVVPVNAKLHPAEAEWIIGNAEARWAFVTRDVAPQPLAGAQRQVEVEASGARGPVVAQQPRDTLHPLTQRIGMDIEALGDGGQAWTELQQGPGSPGQFFAARGAQQWLHWCGDRPRQAALLVGL